MTRLNARLLLVAAIALPFAACSLNNETVGLKGTPSGGAMFAQYSAIGTSISAGIQSGGINDSTQRGSFVYQLALAMGLTPGVNWYYPSFGGYGCPAPFTNPLANQRVGGTSSTYCGFRTVATPYVNNTGIPFLRAAAALDITALAFPATDSMKLAQFITGSVSPVNMVLKEHPTFVTVEVGANDALHAATRGDPSLLTPLVSFTASITAIADSLDSLSPKPNVAILTVPDVTLLPYLSRGLMFYCLHTGCAGLGIAATPPWSNAAFVVDNNCAPNAVIAGSKGDSSFVGFNTTAGILNILVAGAAATLDCVTGAVTINIGAGFVTPNPATQFPVYVLTPTKFVTVVNAVIGYNAAIATVAGRTNWTSVPTTPALAANAALIPPFPSFTTPTALFGTLFSLDGVHPTRAGQRILAQAVAKAIDAKFGTSLCSNALLTPCP